MPRASLLVTSCAVLFGVSAACGARTGLPPPTCTGEPVGQVRQVPNLYFILDRSGSMTEGSPSKWDVVRNDIAALMTTLGKEAEFGAAWFPPPPPPGVRAGCVTGTEIMTLRLGDGRPASAAGSTANTFLTLTNVTPVGGTPTAETFVALTPKLKAVPGHTFAILATDGGPNCNLSLSCGVKECTLNIDSRNIGPFDGMKNYVCEPAGPSCCDPSAFGTGAQGNCLDGPRTVAAVAALAAAGVPTFAIGVPGSEAYSSILDQIAQVGGTARATNPPLYYKVNTANEHELVDALDNIAARIAASCEVELKHAPSADQANLVVAGKLVPQSGANGWTVSGNFLTLLGKTCDEVRTVGEKVVVTEGCPTLVK